MNTNLSNPSPCFAFDGRFLDIIHTELKHHCVLHCDLIRRNTIGGDSCGKEGRTGIPLLYSNTPNHFFSNCLFDLT